MLRTLLVILFILFVFGPPQLLAETEQDKEGNYLLGEWLDVAGVSLSGSVELELQREESFVEAGEKGRRSFARSASVELGLSWHPLSWLTAELQASWDDETAPAIDEKWLTLGDVKLFPVYLSVGEMTLPFGLFESEMLSDSLPQEIGEAVAEAVMLGADWQGVQAAVFVYDGKAKVAAGHSGFSRYGLNLGYQFGEEGSGLLLGGSWVSSMDDADGLLIYLTEEDLTLNDEVSSVIFYSLLTFGSWTVSGEYIESLDRPEFIGDDGTETGPRRSAWLAEVAYKYAELENVACTLAVSYGETSGLSDFLPKRRLGAVMALTHNEHLRFALEFLREKDYSVGDGGTGDSANRMTVQVAYDF